MFSLLPQQLQDAQFTSMWYNSTVTSLQAITMSNRRERESVTLHVVILTTTLVRFQRSALQSLAVIEGNNKGSLRIRSYHVTAATTSKYGKQLILHCCAFVVMLNQKRAASYEAIVFYVKAMV